MLKAAVQLHRLSGICYQWWLEKQGHGQGTLPHLPMLTTYWPVVTWLCRSNAVVPACVVDGISTDNSRAVNISHTKAAMALGVARYSTIKKAGSKSSKTVRAVLGSPR